MKTSRQIFTAAAVTLGLLLSASVGAQTTAVPAMTDGDVRKVDLANGKITIKHAEIKHLDMPGMTMVFTARDPALLTRVKPGDKIRFLAVDDGGKMVITDIQPKD